MLNSRSWLLYVRVKLRGGGKSCNFLLALALFAPHQLLLAWSGLLAQLPGALGRKARLAADTVHAMLLQLMHSEPQNIADVDLRDKEQQVRVVVRTVGLTVGIREGVSS